MRNATHWAKKYMFPSTSRDVAQKPHHSVVVFLSVYDLMYNGLVLFHMKLAGVLIVCVGFVLVMFPENWAVIIASVVR